MEEGRRLREMEYEWIASKGVEMGGTCGLVHQGSCSFQFLRKLAVVSKIGIKYYLPFHLFPLLMRLRKAKDTSEVLTVIGKRIFYYTKSILFMAFLVAGTKGALCFGSTQIRRLDGWLLAGNATIAPLGILLEEGSRQREIGCFVLAKAVRSIYLLLKRRGILDISHDATWMHVILMAIFYYFYSHHPSTVKFSAACDEIWGNS